MLILPVGLWVVDVDVIQVRPVMPNSVCVNLWRQAFGGSMTAHAG